MALDKNFVGELTARVLRNHIEDMRNNNLVPVVVDAYLQGGTEYVSGLKELLDSAGIDKKRFNDAIEKSLPSRVRCSQRDILRFRMVKLSGCDVMYRFSYILCCIISV